ncbi:MAG: pullulanase-type alpha-1,6-glucosidase [Caldilineaceae bacterium]|nr:pullulanase-type alpha-1,6-glucosidase [Caldilineaceae bacterium]
MHNLLLSSRRAGRVLLIAAVLLSPLAGIFPQPVTAAPPAQSTPDPTSVTLAGDLQDELGCAGEWDPACTATRFTYDATDDVWQLTATLPAGSYQYKAALNDGWDESYGANGGSDNIAISVDAEAEVKWYYDHKSHWVTDNVNSRIATAAGDFQSALGCPGDWQPDCLLSWLQDVDGDGVYTLDLTGLPAGDYQFKAAMNEGWDESYGVDGGPDNIAFSVAAAQTASLRFDGATSLPGVTVSGGGDEDWAALATPPVRHPFQNEIMYFVMPDRFANGDTTNDTGGIGGDALENGFDPTDSGFFHGGDLAGLESKLDYLAGMGITSIWMTPVFKNNPVQGTGADVSAGYHGYWITDFTQFDPHFGTNAELEELISAADVNDISVFFDIITNHTADILDYEEGQYAYRNKADYPYTDADGNAFDDRDYVNDPAFPALDAETSFPYTPVFNNAGDENLKVPAWLNNPVYYHNRGNSQFAGENSLYGDFYGLDDLFTEQPAVTDGMIQIYKDWITNYGIAGFRIDTMKHVNVEFWEKFAAELRAHADSVGKEDFFFFGEVFSGNEDLLSFYTTQTETPAVLDFKLQEAIRTYVSQQGSAAALQALFANDDKFIDADSNAAMLPLFTGNHDRGRFGYFLKEDNGDSLSDADMLARTRLAHAMLYLVRGVPVVYYGDEQGFTGIGGDKSARQDMFPSQVAEYNDAALNDMIGTDATPADDNFDTGHPLYAALAEFAQLYQAYPALRTGAQIHRYANDGPGIYAFSRYDRDEQVEYVIALNNAAGEQSATFPVYDAGMTFNLLAGNSNATLTSDGDSNLTVTVPAMDFVVYQAQPALMSAAAFNVPGIAITQPASDSQVTLGVTNIDGNDVPQRMEIAAELDQANVYAEVTFAVRTSGASDWTVIGTDDNPPYRVFYDAQDLPTDTQLDFAAVVNDLSGDYAGATVTGVTPVTDDGGGAGGSYDYAVIHYLRSDDDYGDAATGDYNDYWGLHLWGDAIDPGEGTEWTSPKPFLGEDSYGRFAWIKLQDSSQDVNFIVHRGDTKDGTEADRGFNPNTDGPEIWLKQDDGEFYASQAAAQGYVTIHYQRPDGEYDGWGLHLWGDVIADGVGTEWSSPRPADGMDDFGAYWNVPVKPDAVAAGGPVNFIIHNGDDKDPGPDQSVIPNNQAHAYIVSMDETIYAQQGDAENFVILHYHRPGGDYGDYAGGDYTQYWGLHTWGAADDPGWATPRQPAGEDAFGVYFKVPLTDKSADLGYILHRGDEKDPGPDQFLNFAKWGFEVWQLQEADPEKPYILPILDSGPAAGGDLSKYQAHWVSADTIAWDVDAPAGAVVQLTGAPDGGLALTTAGITGGESITLTQDPAGLPDAIKAQFPHLAGFAAFKLGADDLTKAGDLLKGQLAVSLTQDGLVTAATGLQIPGVLDDLYAYDGDLGVTWDGDTPTIRVWAPTARSVKFHLFADSASDPAEQVLEMTAGEQGTWSVTGDAGWKNKFYLFEVEVYVHSTGQVEHNMVTDPYSLSLSMNSARSQIVNLDDPELKPEGWDEWAEELIYRFPEDFAVYELHVRDFSANDPSVPDDIKGTFEAFTLADSNGVNHLKALADAGLTHVHLLPAFDIATINEDKSAWQTPNIPVDVAPDSSAPRDAVAAVADEDAFNWGYDPYHYTVPEGSYSTDPDGAARIREFRAMILALRKMDLFVVMDVVYNHTNASGQAEKSVLDKIVPGYYHRLDLDGSVTTSTCCQNTATEHKMMEKLMVDSLDTWSTAYWVGGFRFDLMGHHMVSNMEAVREALGDQTLIYGEGWNFGEVQDGQRGENATQINMAGTGIGTFNDRLRDAVRGGGPFDEGAAIVANQGFISGVYYDPNEANSGSDAEKAEMLLSADQIRVGLAGNLADYEFENAAGDIVKGSEIDYNGAPVGYTQDPQEQIIYISAHDNETLWDITQYKLPAAVTMAERVMIQNLGMDFTLLAQGVPFIHAGADLLRSKSLDRDSYNSGDWFNKLDFTYQDNNWGVGLPPLTNADAATAQALLANPDLNPAPEDIQAAAEHVQEMLAIRASSPLFRLKTKEDVMARLAFHNTGPDQLPGLIVMSISDMVDGMVDLDDQHEMVVALFNVNDQSQSFTEPALIGMELELHPIQEHTHNPAVRAAMANHELSFDPATGTFELPPRMTAVFVLPQSPTAIDDDAPPNYVPADMLPRMFLPMVTK